MPIDLEQFEPAYEKWVEEGMPDFLAGNLSKILKDYPSIIPDDIPWTPYTGKPSEQTFALVTSAGLYLKGRQPAFETDSIHGDPSLREIPKTVQQAEIGIAHAHYDHSLAEQDINIIFPIHRLLELENEGTVGKVAETHYSCSYVNNVAPLVRETVPEIISRIKAEGVHVVLLVPV